MAIRQFPILVLKAQNAHAQQPTNKQAPPPDVAAQRQSPVFAVAESPTKTKTNPTFTNNKQGAYAR